jgi:hypothetical protein
MSRTIIIGDPQGCLKETLTLLEKCKVTPSDHVIFVGDMVDRGPESGGCLDLAMRREALQGKPAAILGNHEDKHLYYRDLEDKGRDPKCVIPTHVATRKQLTAEHYQYMRRLPLYLRLPEYNAVVVHAGVFPGVAIENQSPHHLLHIQMINPPNRESKWPSKSPEGWTFWTHHWDGPERIIFGHSVFDKPLVTDKVVGIDGGGCFGMQLHALILPGWDIVSVPCAVNYGKGSRGRSGDAIKKIPIHGDVSSFS